MRAAGNNVADREAEAGGRATQGVLSAVGFDLDDTLAVPERDRATLLADATDAVGAPALSREAYLRAHGEDRGTETREPIFAALLDDHETTVQPATLASAYREAVESALVPVTDAAALVRSLREQYRVGLLTDGPVRAQRGKLETLGWTDLFDAVVVTGALPAGKPDGRAFERLLAELGTEAGETAYVGDHPEADVAGAAAAGLIPIQVLDGPDAHPHPAAAATVQRDRLAAELPSLLAEF